MPSRTCFVDESDMISKFVEFTEEIYTKIITIGYTLNLERDFDFTCSESLATVLFWPVLRYIMMDAANDEVKRIEKDEQETVEK